YTAGAVVMQPLRRGRLLLVEHQNVVDLLSVRIGSGDRYRPRLAVRRDNDVVRREHLALQLVLDVVGMVVELLEAHGILPEARLAVDRSFPWMVGAIEGRGVFAMH